MSLIVLAITSWMLFIPVDYARGMGHWCPGPDACRAWPLWDVAKGLSTSKWRVMVHRGWSPYYLPSHAQQEVKSSRV